MLNWYDLPTYYDVSFSYEMSDELAFLKKFLKNILIHLNQNCLNLLVEQGV